MSENDAMLEAVDRTKDNAVPVDSGMLLIVDPCHLDAATLAKLTQPNEHGVTRAVVRGAPGGDGWWSVSAEDDELAVYRT